MVTKKEVSFFFLFFFLFYSLRFIDHLKSALGDTHNACNDLINHHVIIL